MFERRCDCYGDVVIFVSQLPLDYYNLNVKNLKIATGLYRIVMHVLTDAPPSVPPRGEPMVFVFTSRKRKLEWERARLKGIGKRYVERLCRRGRRNEREWNGYVDERDSEESSEEERVA